MNVDFTEDSSSPEWFFFYAGYSFQEKRASAYIWSGEMEYKASTDAHHMIPKCVGIYLGKNFQGGLSDPTVCVSGSDHNCVTDDYTELMNAQFESIEESGFIPSHGPNPQVEVEVPDNQVQDITEYGFGMWFRF